MFKSLKKIFSKKQPVQPLSTEEEAELQAYYIEKEKKDKAAIDAQDLAEFDKRAAAAAKRRAEATSSNAAKLTSNTNAHPVVLQSVFQQENQAKSDYLKLQNVVNSMPGPSEIVMMRKFLNGRVDQAGSIDPNQLNLSVNSYLIQNPNETVLYNSYLSPTNYIPIIDNPVRENPLHWRYQLFLPTAPTGNKGGRTRRKGKRTNKRFNKKSHNKRYTKKR